MWATDPTTKIDPYKRRERSSPKFVVVRVDNAGKEANRIDVEMAYSKDGMCASVSSSSYASLTGGK